MPRAGLRTSRFQPRPLAPEVRSRHGLAAERWRIIFCPKYPATALGLNQTTIATARFLSACEGFDSSVIAAVEPTPVQRCVLYTFADVPLNAGRLVVSQVASTARQEHQRGPNERGFDDGEHPRDPPLYKLAIAGLAAGTKARKKASPHAHRRWMTTV